MADQHNAKCTGWGRFPTDVHTPNLERLADTGTRFERAFAQSPICTPSRTSYLTGQYPTNHGWYANGGTAPDHLSTVFDAASQLDYRTGAFGKIHTPEGLIEDDVDAIQATHCHPSERDERSPYEADLAERGVLDDRDDAPKDWDWDGPLVDARPSELAFEDQPEYWATERAKSFVQRDDDRPFFAWLSFHRPHQVYTPAAELWDLYPDDELELPPSADEDLSDKPPTQRATRERHESADGATFEPRTYDALRRRKLRGYLGCVSMVDACVGRLLDFLEAEGLREDTIVVYCADHGDFAVEHGLLEKAPGVSYDAVTRVPFVWSWPGEIREGETCPELVESTDLFPTLVRLMGERPPASADGYDLTGYLRGDRTEPVREYAVAENPWAKCVRTRDEKLTVYPRGFFGEESEAFLEFYDLDDDPWETANVADDPAYEDAVDRHRRLLYEFLATHRRPWLSPLPETAPDEDARVDVDDPRVSPHEMRRSLAEFEGSNYM